MFGIFKSKNEEKVQISEESKEKSFFSKALEKTLGNIKHIVPTKKRKLLLMKLKRF